MVYTYLGPDLPPYVCHRPTKHEIYTPAGIKWSGAERPPPIGASVTVRINRIGLATVVGYFTEHGWLGLLVKPHNPPPWYVKQNGRGATCHVFGVEVA